LPRFYIVLRLVLVFVLVVGILVVLVEVLVFIEVVVVHIVIEINEIKRSHGGSGQSGYAGGPDGGLGLPAAGVE
jgi:hypothetical protein